MALNCHGLAILSLRSRARMDCCTSRYALSTIITVRVLHSFLVDFDFDFNSRCRYTGHISMRCPYLPSYSVHIFCGYDQSAVILLVTNRCSPFTSSCNTPSLDIHLNMSVGNGQLTPAPVIPLKSSPPNPLLVQTYPRPTYKINQYKTMVSC